MTNPSPQEIREQWIKAVRDDEFQMDSTENEDYSCFYDEDKIERWWLDIMAKDRAATLAMVEELVVKADKDIRLADKTPKYEYSHNRCDANNAGKFPEEVGTRWAMPWEISKGLVSQIRSLLTVNQEK